MRTVAVASLSCRPHHVQVVHVVLVQMPRSTCDCSSPPLQGNRITVALGTNPRTMVLQCLRANANVCIHVHTLPMVSHVKKSVRWIPIQGGGAVRLTLVRLMWQPVASSISTPFLQSLDRPTIIVSTYIFPETTYERRNHLLDLHSGRSSSRPAMFRQ